MDVRSEREDFCHNDELKLAYPFLMPEKLSVIIFMPISGQIEDNLENYDLPAGGQADGLRVSFPCPCPARLSASLIDNFTHFAVHKLLLGQKDLSAIAI